MTKSVSPEAPNCKKTGLLDDVIKLGYFFIPFFFYQQLMVLVLTASYLFPTFGSRLPALTSCGNESFESIPLAKRCEHLSNIRNSGDTCSPEFDTDFWSLPQELNYYCDTVYIIKRATTVQMIGQFVGECIAGQLSDIFGRKKVLIGGISAMFVSLLSVSFTADLYSYSVAMFFISVFSSYLVTVDTAYFVEMVPQKHVVWGFMFIGFSPNVILFAGIAYISGDFRTLGRICAGITFALLIMQLWCPESPRWLLQRKRVEQAHNVVKRLHRWNRTLTPSTEKYLETAFCDEKLRQNEAENKEDAKSNKKYYFYHIFLTITMIKQVLTMCFMYAVFYLGYYALIFNMELLPGNVFVNTAIVGAARWIINIIYGVTDLKCADIGRKSSSIVIILVAISLTVLISVMAILDLSHNWITTAAIISVGALSSHIFIIVGIVAGEVFPTPVRNGAIGLVHIFGRFGLILAPLFFQGFLFYPPGAYIFMGILFIIAFGLFLFNVPETKGVPLNDQMPDETEWLWGRHRKDNFTQA